MVVLWAPVCKIVDFFAISTLIVVCKAADDGSVVRMLYYGAVLMFGSAVMGERCEQEGLSTQPWGIPIFERSLTSSLEKHAPSFMDRPDMLQF